MTHAQLAQADLRKARFVHAKLEHACFDHARGEGVDFMDAALSGASLHRFSEDGAQFRGADLSNVTRTDPARAAGEDLKPG